MFVGIEETTDSRYPETRIQKFRTESRAVEWLMDPKAGHEDTSKYTAPPAW